MNNTSLFRIATMHSPFVLRAPVRLTAMIRLFVSYLQMLMLRAELLYGDQILLAYMTGQVCYLERLLRMYISPQAVITDQAEDVILYRSDEPGTDLFINDIAGQLFYKTAEFNSSGFTVILPPAVVTLEGYARELLNKYKQPGFTYTIIYQ